MKKELVWKYTTFLGACLMLQLLWATSIFAYCVHREGATIEFPSGGGTWVEECCDGRPSHWPASAMPIPVYIYSNTPDEFIPAITNAVDSWNNVASSTFEMQIVGTIASKSAIFGAVVLGFDPDHCADDNDCGLAGTWCDAVSVDGSWDGYQIQQCTIFADANAHDWDEPGGPGSQRVMTHELGHVLGIMHPGSNPHGPGGAGCGPEFNGATMACCGGQIDASSLELDDMASATSLYPKWKFTVEVVDGTNTPIANAAVWMDNTCFPHEGENRFEGGMVFGDIDFCLTGDLEPSNTYYPNFTYITEANGRTGEFRVMHSDFCFTVMADGFADSYGCFNLPAPGNYITTVVMNRPPVAECQDQAVSADQNCEGSASVDNGSYDPDGDPITVTEVPPPPYQLGDTQVTLTVTDSPGATDTCQATVTVIDDTPPVIACNAHDIIPPDVPITFTASVSDNCGAAIEVSDYDCWRINGASKLKSKKESCVVSVNGDTITIDDSGGVGTTIEWTSAAVDTSGNQKETTCTIKVLHPKGK